MSTHNTLVKDENFQYYKYPNESFSGCDMTASIVYSWEEDAAPTTAPPTTGTPQGKSIKSVNAKTTTTSRVSTHVLGEIQTISYSIHMEKRPVRAIGNVNAKDYVMGPRTMAGSLVFAVFNKHFAKGIMAENNDFFKSGKAFLVDELPPFNIVISLANEYGLRSKLVIYGVRLLNEGQVMSVNDVFTENTYQFVATDIEYLNDELSYESRSDNSSLFKLKDDYDNTNKNKNSTVELSDALSHYVDPNKNKIEDIKISVTTVDATRSNPNGRAVIGLFPIQTDGEIKIMNTENEEIKIKANGSTSYPIELEPDMYNVKFSKPNPDAWNCDTKFFSIKEYKEKYSTKKYAPIIEVLTDTSVTVYSNEPTHTHISILKGETVQYHQVKNRKVKINELQRDTVYIITSCNGPDTLSSPTVKIKTFTKFDKPFEDFKKLIEYNQSLLQYKTLGRYYTIIDKAKIHAGSSSNFQTPTNSISQLKIQFESALKALDKESPTYNDDYIELTHNIYACNDLIYLSNKVMNNIFTVINKDPAVPLPLNFLNENYDNAFEFGKDTTSAEFYRINKGVNQFAHAVTSNMFNKVNGKDNSFSYLGKSGVNHFVQALNNHLRSPKLEFYVMTPKEKQDMIDNIESKESISEQVESKINLVVKDELGVNIHNSTLDRAFMRKVKNINNPKLLDAEITDKTDESIKIINPVVNIIDKTKKEKFYVSIAKKNDIISNDYIYKKEFNSSSKSIELNDVDCALFENENYSLWFEDKSFNQISNVTTFNMSIEDNLNDRTILEYELSSIIKDIKSSLYKNLSGSVYSSLACFIEYNEEITKSNIIEKTIEFLVYSGISYSSLIQCLSSLKLMIGLISESDKSICSSIELNKKELVFDCFKESSVNIISINPDNTEYFSTACNIGINSIDISTFDSDYLIAYATTPDIQHKSDVVFINNLTNRIEVL